MDQVQRLLAWVNVRLELACLFDLLVLFFDLLLNLIVDLVLPLLAPFKEV